MGLERGLGGVHWLEGSGIDNTDFDTREGERWWTGLGRGIGEFIGSKLPRGQHEFRHSRGERELNGIREVHRRRSLAQWSGKDSTGFDAREGERVVDAVGGEVGGKQ